MILNLDGTCNTLYKYRAVNQNAISILENHELYFSLPKYLNDPYDCQIDILATLNEAFAEFDIINASKIRSKTIIEAMGEIKKDDKIVQRIQELVDNQAICSFSLLRDNTLMWAHYADSHRGFCIGFNPQYTHEYTKEGFDKIIPQQVIYTDRNPFSPVLDMIVSTTFSSIPPKKYLSTEALYKSIALSAVSTKSLPWSYEKEFRYVRVQDGSGCVKISPLAISELIMGCNMTDADRKKLLNLLSKKMWKHVRLCEVKKSTTRFTFEIVDL